MEEIEPVNVILKPKSDLLDPNFEGYKLNLGKIPIHSKSVGGGVLQAPESDSNYSYQQVRLHALHNHLWQDPWIAGINYYFSSGFLHGAGLDESPGSGRRLRHAPLLPLPTTPAGDGEPAGPPSHPSLALASERLALVADGRGALHVVRTGDRRQLEKWEVQFSLSPLDGCGFVLAHCALDPAGHLHALLEHVTEREAVPEWRADAPEVTFVNLLTWLTLVPDGPGWRLCRLRQAATSGTVHYACLEPSGDALCVAAERRVTLVRDSEKPVSDAAAGGEAGGDVDSAADGVANGDAKGDAEGDAKDQAEDQMETEAQPLYRWSQSTDDVTVQLTSPVATPGLQVALESRRLTVTSGGETVLQGALPAAIRREESTWTVDSGRLELTLSKVQRGEVWSELLVGDRRGRQVADPESLAAAEGAAPAGGVTVEATQEPERPGAVVGAEMEDCDDLPEHGSALCRIDGDTHTVTHQASLSSHQYLMSVRLAAAEMPAFCIRHDVDGLVWQPRSQESSYQCEHVGTLQAFGFVQASKQQRKFLACAPDMSYALICETSRHLYIYHQPSPVEGDLRNRRSGRRVKEVSRQQVVSLEDQDPILGVVAAAGAIYVLTASRLHALMLSAE